MQTGQCQQHSAVSVWKSPQFEIAHRQPVSERTGCDDKRPVYWSLLWRCQQRTCRCDAARCLLVELCVGTLELLSEKTDTCRQQTCWAAWAPDLRTDTDIINVIINITWDWWTDDAMWVTRVSLPAALATYSHSTHVHMYMKRTFPLQPISDRIKREKTEHKTWNTKRDCQEFKKVRNWCRKCDVDSRVLKTAKPQKLHTGRPVTSAEMR